MRLVSDLKGAGYITSTISVLLLGAVSARSAVDHPWFLAALLLGMATSVCGMMLRWRSHRLEQKKKDAREGGDGSKRLFRNAPDGAWRHRPTPPPGDP
jgi:hypothetical protein